MSGSVDGGSPAKPPWGVAMLTRASEAEAASAERALRPLTAELPGVKESDIEKLSEVLGDLVKEGLVVQELLPETHIDAQCSLNQITHELVSQFDRLAPFGTRNPEPIICTRNVQVSYPTVVGNRHLKMRVYGDGVSCSSIWFNKGDYAQDIEGVRLDIAFTPQINYWNGSSNIQLKVRDIAAASTQDR